MHRDLRVLAAAYVSSLACFLAMDACWLGLAGPRVYASIQWMMAARPDWGAAALFYLVYLGGIQMFAVGPALRQRRRIMAVGRGAMLGLFAYATYDLTNQATVRDWPWTVTLVDLAWGTLVSGCAAGAGAWFGHLAGRHRLARGPQASSSAGLDDSARLSTERPPV